MSYAETSFAGPSLWNGTNPTPTHFAHIAAWQEKARLDRIRDNCTRITRNAKRSRY